MGRLRCAMVLALTVAAGLGLGCESFHLPVYSPISSARTVCWWPSSPIVGRAVVSPRRVSLVRPGQPHQLQALDSQGELKPATNQSMGVSVDAQGSQYTPSALWWTKSRAEEDATMNLAANAGFIAGVALFATVTFFTVDSEISRGWTAGEFFLRMPVDNWFAYMDVLRDNPVLVKACTSGTVYALGDWTAQTFEGTTLADIKRGRVYRSALAGLLLHGPLSHVWYDVCEGIFDWIGWNEYWWVAGPKVITDQILWGPFWNAVYICFLGTLKKDSFETIREAVVTTALPLVLAGIRLWPLAHLVTYGLIPTENRLLWVDFVEIIWVTILSKQAAEQARSAENPEMAEMEPENGGQMVS